MTEEKEPVGSVTEELAKLLGVLRDMATEDSQKSDTMTAGISSAFQTLSEHAVTGGQSCRYCPVCQLIGLVRQTSPEVKQHLGTAASSILHAVNAAFSADARRSEAWEPVEKINLSDDVWDDAPGNEQGPASPSRDDGP